MISVITSIYNETLDEISQSINSILGQSCSDFEVIVVIDNPDRNDVVELLTKIEISDNRLYHIVNSKNVGLAMSMNKAAQLSKGEYLVRMDADDICEQNRFEIQRQVIEDFDVDVVCSDYQHIDEAGNELQIQHYIPSDKDLVRNLPYDSAIHHPTVMMKKSAFFRVGGYRDFPCAQDYDLWLRMLDIGCTFKIIPQKLLKYRVRNNSISQSIRVKQHFTIKYCKKLFKERIKKGTDSYSKENYEKYLRKHNVYNKKYCDNVNKCKELKVKIDQNRNSIFRKALYILIICCKSSFYVRYYMDIMIIKMQMIGCKFIEKG